MGIAAPRIPAFGAALARLFTLQAAWDYERMQGVGFGFAVEPMLRALPGGPSGEAYHRALARQSRFFNAHPYLVALAVGAAARAEIDGDPPEKIERLRAAMCGPLGALGDRLIWAGWLPACMAVALMLVAAGAGVWAAAAFLVLYNIVHVYLRVWALKAGWREGLHVAAALSSPLLRVGSELAGPVGALLVGAAIPILLGWLLRGAPGEAMALSAGLAALGAVLVRVLRTRASGLVVAGVALVVTSVCGVLWP